MILPALTMHRLTVLRNYLRDKVPADRFNLSTWVGTNSAPWKGADDLSCGTVACAVGWGTTIPEFQKAGLKLVRRDPDDGVVGAIRYGDVSSFHAVSKFFDISPEQVNYLFYARYYMEGTETSKDEVVSRISSFLTHPLSDQDICEGRDLAFQPFTGERVD